jgi:hypothetical protein
VNITYTNFLFNNFSGFGPVVVLDDGDYFFLNNYGTVDDNVTCQFAAVSPAGAANISCVDYDLQFPVVSRLPFCCCWRASVPYLTLVLFLNSQTMAPTSAPATIAPAMQELVVPTLSPTLAQTSAPVVAQTTLAPVVGQTTPAPGGSGSSKGKGKGKGGSKKSMKGMSKKSKKSKSGKASMSKKEKEKSKSVRYILLI